MYGKSYIKIHQSKIETSSEGQLTMEAGRTAKVGTSAKNYFSFSSERNSIPLPLLSVSAVVCIN